MSQKVEIFKVFISSPNDLAEERACISQAVTLTSKLLRAKGVALEAWRWETDATSEFGDTPQSLIDAQLGTYDIYFGLMGARFGSSTMGFGSGTEKEFNDALMAQKRGILKRVSFFFKDVSLSTNELDEKKLEQLMAVHAFKKKTEPLGIQRSFKNLQELQELIIQTIHHIFENHIEPGRESPRIMTKSIQISPSFADDVLKSVDEEIVGRSDVELDDIWTEPDLKMSIIEGTAVKTRYVALADIRTEINNGRSFQIHGVDASGKSSVARKLYMMLFNQGLIPVLLDGRRLNTTDFNKLKARIISHIVAQYDGISHAEARSLDPKSTVVILDDFDRSPIGSKHLMKILDNLKATYKAVQIITSTSFLFVPLEAGDQVGGFGDLWKVQIAELGHRKRYHLIEKWLRLQATGVNPTEDFRGHVEKLRNEVNRVLVHHIVPRTPIITLILLQAIEAKQSGDLIQSGYVRYYKFLIDNMILRNLTPTEAEYAYAVLPVLACAIFNDDQRRLTPDGATKVLEEFSLKRALRKDILYSVLARLKQIGMFAKDESYYRFKHGYAYNFFLADFISQDLGNRSTAEFIEGILEGVWNQENVTLLIFLSFFSNSAIVVNGLINRLSNAYADQTPLDFSNERSAAIKQLIDTIPGEIADHEKTTEKREMRLAAADSADRSRTESRDGVTERPLGMLEDVFSAVDLVGHVLRNHNARLDAEPKRLMYEAATGAILRSIASFYTRISENLDVLVGYMSSALANISQSEEREKIARAMLFILAVGFLYFNVKRLSLAVGDENLELTYKNAIKGIRKDTADVLEVFIKLDCFGKLPLRELESVVAKSDKNHVLLAALRTAVAERIDMRPPDQQDFRKICAIVGIQERQRLIERQRLGSPGS